MKQEIVEFTATFHFVEELIQGKIHLSKYQTGPWWAHCACSWAAGNFDLAIIIDMANQHAENDCRVWYHAPENQ